MRVTRRVVLQVLGINGGLWGASLKLDKASPVPIHHYNLTLEEGHRVSIFKVQSLILSLCPE